MSIKKNYKMNSTINEPTFSKDWILKNIINFNKEDLILMEEEIRHERIMKQRILKLNKIRNESNFKKRR